VLRWSPTLLSLELVPGAVSGQLTGDMHVYLPC